MRICKEELSFISAAELRRLRITRKELHRVFAEGEKLMQSERTGARAGPIAYELRAGGGWDVCLCHYSQATYKSHLEWRREMEAAS